MADWITAEAAAERLGVKRATLYAYVSRGVLGRRRDPGGRGSLFDAREVEELARRGRPRRPPGSELIIESALTEISGDRLRYRGHEATALAASRTFEEVAELLWTGELPPPGGGSPGHGDSGSPEGRRGHGSSGGNPGRWSPGGGSPGRWSAAPEAVAAAAAAQAALPARALPLERLQVIVPALAAADPLRLHLDRPGVIAAGRAMIGGMTDCLPGAVGPAGSGRLPGAVGPAGSGRLPGAAASAAAGGVAGPAGPAASGGLSDAAGSAAPGRPPGSAPGAGAASIAGRLWPKVCPEPPEPGLARALGAALVLLADHELAASTLAARVAASVRADPYAVVATGLGALGGPLHGGASLGAEGMLAAAAAPGDAPRVVGDLLRMTGRVPGFGHFVYQAGDPRAVCLLGLIAAAVPGHPRLAVADAVLAEMRRRALPEPNIDFALAVLKDVAGMISGAGEAIFAVARTAGWIAHAAEEYERDIPLRPRAVYTGPSGGGPA